MSILSDFEDRVAGTVEGVFAGVFRSPVQPAELARASAREMDRRRKLGVGKVYAPTMYSVLLSSKDADQLGGFADTLAGELETYLVGHAREKGYELTTRPRVQFLVDEALRLGRFEVIGELLSAEEIEAEYIGSEDRAPAKAPLPSVAPIQASAMPADTPVTAVVPAAAAQLRTAEAGSAVTGPAGPHLVATIDGVRREFALSGERLVIGRLKACDICVHDQNASREHAAIVFGSDGWALVDLGSTNGTLLNGRQVDTPTRLCDRDVITVGTTELVFVEPKERP